MTKGMGLYVLGENDEPKLCESIEEWGAFMGDPNNKRLVKVTLLANGGRVSTVFLGADHSFGNARPLLYETMVFVSDHSHGVGEGLDGAMQRYTTRDEALAGHDKMVEMVYEEEPALRLVS